MIRAKQIILDAPVFLQVVLHCVGNTQVVSGQRAEEVFVPGRKKKKYHCHDYFVSFLGPINTPIDTQKLYKI